MNSKKQRKLTKVRERLRYTSKKYTLAVRISNKNIYVLIMCSKTRNVLSQVSTLTPGFRKIHKDLKNNLDSAKAIGEYAAKHIQEKGYSNDFAFDRGDKKFMGKLKVVIDSAVATLGKEE